MYGASAQPPARPGADVRRPEGEASPLRWPRQNCQLAFMLWKIQMLLWRIRRQDPRSSCTGGSAGRIQIQIALEDPSAGSKIKCPVRWRIRFEPTMIRLQDPARWLAPRQHLQNEYRVATGDSCAGGEGVRFAPLGMPGTRPARCFLFIVASSASVCTAAGSAPSNGGCAEDAPRPERPAPLEPGGT
jgi:hypothetical protein